jgi:hypothetical protein
MSKSLLKKLEPLARRLAEVAVAQANKDKHHAPMVFLIQAHDPPAVMAVNPKTVIDWHNELQPEELAHELDAFFDPDSAAYQTLAEHNFLTEMVIRIFESWVMVPQTIGEALALESGVPPSQFANRRSAIVLELRVPGQCLVWPHYAFVVDGEEKYVLSEFPDDNETMPLVMRMH